MATSTKSKSPPTRRLHLAWPYILWYSGLEGLSAFGAIYTGFRTPQDFLYLFAPTPLSLAEIGLASPTLTPMEDMLLAQTFSLYAYFTIVDLVLLQWTLRTPLLNSVPEARLRIWTIIMWAGVASDLFYLLSMWRVYASPAAGADALVVFWRPWLWQKHEWLTVGLTWPPFFMRFFFLAGVGIKVEKERRD